MLHSDWTVYVSFFDMMQGDNGKYQGVNRDHFLYLFDSDFFDLSLYHCILPLYWNNIIQQYYCDITSVFIILYYCIYIYFIIRECSSVKPLLVVILEKYKLWD